VPTLLLALAACAGEAQKAPAGALTLTYFTIPN